VQLGIRTAISRRLSQSFLDPRQDLSAARLIVGSGRSGTTWLQELACRAGKLRPVFEPFHAAREPGFSDVPFGRYIRPDAQDHDLRGRVHEVLSGKLRSKWQDHLCHPGVYRGRVVKEIRNLLWAGWLSRNFPQVPIVYLIRHPLAVAASSRALDWAPEHFDRMARQPELFTDHLSKVGTAPDQLTSKWHRTVAAWCIENIVAIRTLAGTGAQLLIYEEALARPSSVSSVLEHLRVPADKLEGIRAPSVTTRPDSPIREASGSSTSWTASTDAALVEEGMDMLRIFGFDDFFSPDGAVDCAALRSAWDEAGGSRW